MQTNADQQGFAGSSRNLELQLGAPFSADPLPGRVRRPPLPDCSTSGASKTLQDALNMLERCSKVPPHGTFSMASFWWLITVTDSVSRSSMMPLHSCHLHQ